MLEIRNLVVQIDDKRILNGLDLTVDDGEVAAIMGPNGSGKSTLSYVIAGKEDYEVLDGEILLDGAEPAGDGARRARRRGRLPRLPVSAGDPGRRHHDLPQGGAERPAQGARRGRADDAGLHQARQRGGEPARDPEGHAASAAAQRRLLRRREEAHGDPADGAARSRPSASSTRPIPASTSTRCAIVAEGVNALRSPDRAFLVITHYQRLLNHIVPDTRARDVERPHRAVGRQGAGARARGERLRRLPPEEAA